MSQPQLQTESKVSLKRQVLFVDDDQPFLETVGQLFLDWSQGNWQLHLASNTARALAILDQTNLDLVVIDLQMPVVDGAQFLQMLQRRSPGLAKVVLTGYGSEEVRSSILRQGADLFLEKPRSPEEFQSVFAALNELADWQSQEGFRGLLRQVGLSDVLQMECLARNSSILELKTNDVEGRIFIEAGKIIHAEAGSMTGEDAFNALLALKGGNFSLKPFAKPTKPSISSNWEFLIMEAARQADEEKGNPKTQAPAGVPVSLSDSPNPARASAAPGANQPRQIDEVVVCSGKEEVLYSWECRDLEARIKLMHMIQQKGEALARGMGLGQQDRLIIHGPQGTVVAQFQNDRKLWVRSSVAGTAPTKEGA